MAESNAEGINASSLRTERTWSDEGQETPLMYRLYFSVLTKLIENFGMISSRGLYNHGGGGGRSFSMYSKRAWQDQPPGSPKLISSFTGINLDLIKVCVMVKLELCYVI